MGWVFIYKLSGCEFESRYNHLNFRYHACFEEGIPWHSGKYRVWIHSETRTWHDKNLQSIPLSHIEDYRCLNIVVDQITRNRTLVFLETTDHLPTDPPTTRRPTNVNIERQILKHVFAFYRGVIKGHRRVQSTPLPPFPISAFWKTQSKSANNQAITIAATMDAL